MTIFVSNSSELLYNKEWSGTVIKNEPPPSPSRMLNRKERRALKAKARRNRRRR